jgi:hypothetical protein
MPACSEASRLAIGVGAWLRSVPRALRDLSSGRTRCYAEHVGELLRTSDGRTYVPFRHTRKAEAAWSRAAPAAVLQPRFHLTPLEPGRRRLHALFRVVCAVTTPLFVGLRGFRSKLWMVDPATGDFAGLYEWDDVVSARSYAEGLARVLRVLAAPGSVSYEVVEGLTVDEYLASHSGDDVLVDGFASARSRVSWKAVGDAIEGVALMVPTVIGAPLLRRLYNRWGTTKGELVAAMPGDELIDRPDLTSTRAVTIDSPPDEVWRWLVQIGQGRGGLYSYDALENAVGCRIHSADVVVEELQHLAVGDVIRLGPDGYPAFDVVAVDPPGSLVLRSRPGGDTRSAGHDDELVSTWAWTLRPRGQCGTRLVSRQRIRFPARQSVLWHIVEPIGFLMERRMLRGIAARAEREIPLAPPGLGTTLEEAS